MHFLAISVSHTQKRKWFYNMNFCEMQANKVSMGDTDQHGEGISSS